MTTDTVSAWILMYKQLDNSYISLERNVYTDHIFNR